MLITISRERLNTFHSFQDRYLKKMTGYPIQNLDKLKEEEEEEKDEDKEKDREMNIGICRCHGV